MMMMVTKQYKTPLPPHIRCVPNPQAICGMGQQTARRRGEAEAAKLQRASGTGQPTARRCCEAEAAKLQRASGNASLLQAANRLACRQWAANGCHCAANGWHSLLRPPKSIVSAFAISPNGGRCSDRVGPSVRTLHCHGRQSAQNLVNCLQSYHCPKLSSRTGNVMTFSSWSCVCKHRGPSSGQCGCTSGFYRSRQRLALEAYRLPSSLCVRPRHRHRLCRLCRLWRWRRLRRHRQWLARRESNGSGRPSRAANANPSIGRDSHFIADGQTTRQTQPTARRPCVDPSNLALVFVAQAFDEQ